MSRSRPRQDSLELLLDTICNTFGGVLFIAMLVILLLQQAGRRSEESAPTTASPVELQSLATQLESVAAKLADLRQNGESQRALVAEFAPAALRDRLQIRNELRSEQESLQAKVDQTLAENAQLAAEVEALARENGAVDEALEDALAKREAAQRELEKSRQARVQEFRVPVVETSSKQEIGLIVRYGRLYVWHKYGPDLERLGLNTDDLVVVGESGDGLLVRPKPTRGIRLDDTPESSAAIRAVLRRFDPQSCYLAFVVRPDSFGQFRCARDAAIEMNFKYRLLPMGEDNPFADRGGRGGRVQ